MYTGWLGCTVAGSAWVVGGWLGEGPGTGAKLVGMVGGLTTGPVCAAGGVGRGGGPPDVTGTIPGDILCAML